MLGGGGDEPPPSQCEWRATTPPADAHKRACRSTAATACQSRVGRHLKPAQPVCASWFGPSRHPAPKPLLGSARRSSVVTLTPGTPLRSDVNCRGRRVGATFCVRSTGEGTWTLRPTAWAPMPTQSPHAARSGRLARSAGTPTRMTAFNPRRRPGPSRVVVRRCAPSSQIAAVGLTLVRLSAAVPL